MAAPGMVSDTASGNSELTSPTGPCQSADGRYVVFTSTAQNLIPSQPEPFQTENVFLYDRDTGLTTLVSHLSGSATAPADGLSLYPTISADGRFVTYVSGADDLVPGQVNQVTSTVQNVFLYDRLTGLNVLVSHDLATPATGGNAYSGPALISADGNFIAFCSQATDLVAEPPGLPSDDEVFLYNRVTGTTVLVSHAYGSPNTPANGGTDNFTDLALSADGQTLAYFSVATNLVDNQATEPGTGGDNLFLYDAVSGNNILVTHAPNSALSVGMCPYTDVSISADGNSVTYLSYATNLVVGQVDSPVTDDVFLYDRTTDTNFLVSHAAASPVTAAGYAGTTVISADGSTIAFTASAAGIMANPIGSGGGNLFIYDRATGTNTLVTYAAGSPDTPSDQGLASAGGSFTSTSGADIVLPAFSANGQFLVYLSEATDIVAGQIDPNGYNGDVYLYNRDTGTNTLLSHSATSPSTTGDAGSGRVSISADGSVIAFDSLAGNLQPGLVDTNESWDVFLFDQSTATISAVSLADPGTPSVTADGPSEIFGTNNGTVSADGGFVVFDSTAKNLVTGEIDDNGEPQVYLANRATGAVSLVSHLAGLPTTAASDGGHEVLSANGRYVAFQEDFNVFLYDAVTGDITFISHQAGNPSALSFDTSNSPVISGDGRYVAYLSDSTNLVAGFVPNPSSSWNVYLFDRLTGTNTLITHLPGSPTAALGENVSTVSISTDGSTVLYGSGDLYLYDVASGSTTLVTHAPGEPTVDVGTASSSEISDDGQTVVYEGNSHLLVGDPNQWPNGDVILYDRATGVNQLVSHVPGSPDQGGNANSNGFTLSGDGSTVYFSSAATNLIAGFVPGNSTSDIYAYNRTTGQVSLVSHDLASPTTGGDLPSQDPVTTADGSEVIFLSEATDLVSGLTKADAPGDYDLYRYDRTTGVISLVSSAVGSTSETSDERIRAATISADGSTIVFGSPSTNLSPNDFNGTDDVFATGPNLALPPAVTGVTTSAGNGQTTLSWASVSGAIGYNIYRATGSGSEQLVQTMVAGTTFTDSGLVSGVTYFYQVAAVNAAGEGARSSEVSSTTASGTIWAVDAGGPADDSFEADDDFTGGNTYSTTAPINTSAVTNPAPQAVYQTERFGNFTYTVPNLTPGASYTVRLDFAEIFWTAAGKRLFNVSINGLQVLNNFDIFATAGGKDIAIAETFTVAANPAGQIVITFTSVKDNAKVSGIEITPTTAVIPNAPTGLVATAGNGQVSLTWNPAGGAGSFNLYRGTSSGGETLVQSGLTTANFADTGLTNGTAYYYQVTAVNSTGESSRSTETSATPQAPSPSSVTIDAGGGAIGNFVADTDFSGGETYHNTDVINTSNVTNPAPQAIYQTERYGNFSYTVPNLTPGASYTVRLDFAEIFWTAAGKRLFNVAINGQQVLTNFDIFATAGGKDIAIAETFTATANPSGQVVITFTSVKDNAKVSGIEITPTTAAVLNAPTGLVVTAGNGQAALSWNSVSGAASYNLYRGTTSGGETLVQSGLTSANFTDTGLTNGTTYFYRVTAVNSAGESGRSGEVSATPRGTSPTAVAIDAGGGAAGSFQADTDFSGGRTFNNSDSINTSGVTNPAPQAVYDTERFGNFTYTVGNLTPEASYTVRLDFAEIYWTAAGKRLFNVAINGVQVLTNFDIYATAGGKDIAIAETFTTTADASGHIAITFTSVKDNAKVSGIEIF